MQFTLKIGNLNTSNRMCSQLQLSSTNLKDLSVSTELTAIKPSFVIMSRNVWYAILTIKWYRFYKLEFVLKFS